MIYRCRAPGKALRFRVASLLHHSTASANAKFESNCEAEGDAKHNLRQFSGQQRYGRLCGGSGTTDSIYKNCRSKDLQQEPSELWARPFLVGQ